MPFWLPGMPCGQTITDRMDDGPRVRSSVRKRAGYIRKKGEKSFSGYLDGSRGGCSGSMRQL